MIWTSLYAFRWYRGNVLTVLRQIVDIGIGNMETVEGGDNRWGGCKLFPGIYYIEVS